MIKKKNKSIKNSGKINKPKKDINNSSGINKNRKYLYIGFVILLVGLFFMSNSFFSGLKSFDYNGLTFTNEMFGEIPVFHHYYYFTDKAGDLVKYNFYLRIDPRKNNIPVKGKIEFDTFGKFNYISLDANGLEKCEFAGAAIGSLSAFLTNNQIKVRGAIPDLIQAERNKVDFADCSYPEDRYVVLIKEGEKSKITRDGMCYRLDVANCEILDVVEKFEIQTLIDAKKRAGTIK